MEPSSSLSDVVERIYSWIPRRVESAPLSPTMSRDFWMPDRSCRFCFECESQFSLFNRRHHCRLCGRVFCGKCSLNTIPTSLEEGVPYDERERVRVCNYCYEHQVTEQNSTLPTETTPTFTSLSSAQSMNSSALGPGASVVPSSPKQIFPGGPTRNRPPYLWDEALDESSEQMHTMRTHQGDSSVPGSMSPRARDQPPSPDPSDNRSDDDEDESERQQEEEGESGVSEVQDQPDDDEDESGAELVQDPRYGERKSESSIFSPQSSIGHTPLSDDGSESARRGETSDGKGSSEGMEDNGEDATEFPIYDDAITPKPSPFVDYESNPLIWIPPMPADDQDDEDEDDDAGTSIDYEDDEEEGGGWVPRSPGSVGSVDIKKDKTASYEHREAMQAQVAGHFRNLVAQLLQQKNIDVGEPGNPDSWLEIVRSISWHAASLVKPDTGNGGGMDPGGYVKVKCIASGRPSGSVVVKGIVCRKNVAHKRMTSRYKNPRLLLLGGALEYQRTSNQLSSLDTLLQQERDHLSMTVARIEAHRPNVLLVEKTVSRFAQDILLNKEISLVLNVKRPLLDRIARCVGGHVVQSPETLNTPTPKAVHCELFHVEKFVEEHGSAGGGGKQLTKFLMFFEGCPKPFLGCTVLLKGANGDFLKKVKEVVQLAVFSAYHLQLETSFLEDEGATIPALPGRSTMNVPLLNMHSTYERSKSSVAGSVVPVPRQVQQVRTRQALPPTASPVPSRVNSFGPSVALSNLDNSCTTATTGPISASSSCVSSATNSPIVSPAQSSFGYQSGVSRTSSIGGTSTTTYHHISNGVYPGGQSWQGVSGLSVSLKRNALDSRRNGDVKPEGASSSGGDESLAFEVKALEVNTVSGSSSSSNSDQIVTTTASMVSKGTIREHGDDYHIVPDEVQAHLRVLIQHNWQSEMQLSKEDFPPSPSDRQSILVQLSKRCLAKGAVVKAPHFDFVRIRYYGYADQPLGMFLRDTLFDTSRPCESCDEPGDAHVYCYTHRQGSLTISVKRRADPEVPLSGEKEGRIWMWHRCLLCPAVGGVPPATPRVIMSDAAWGLSFGKFLELSFSTHPAASRVAACGHSLHRDCLRFYGFGSMVACFRYAQITLHSVYLPPLRLEFNCPKEQDWLQMEVDEVSSQANLVYAEVVSRLRELGERIAKARVLYGISTALDAKRRIVALEALLQNEKDAFQEDLVKAAPPIRESGQASADILELNWLRRELFIRSAQWDWRLEYLASKCIPTRRRGTGSVDDSFILSAKELGIGNDNVITPDSLESEIGFSTMDALSSDLESMQGSYVGSIPPEQISIEDASTTIQMSDSGQHAVSEDVNNNQNPVSVTELADGNGLDFRLLKDSQLLSPGAGELLNKIDLSPKKGHVPGSKSVSESSTVPVRHSAYRLERHGEEGSTEASSGTERDAPAELDIPVRSPPRFLEGDITARRALSEGNFPLLADLSDSLETAWTGDGGPVDAPSVVVPEEKPVDNRQVIEECHDPESEGPVQERVSVDQPIPEVVSQEGDLAAQDKSSNSEVQVSVPTSPVKSDSSEDLTEGWMGAPFAKFFRGYSRSSSTLSINSDVKVTPPGLPAIPRAAKLITEGGGARVLLPQGHDDVVVAVYDDEPTTKIAYALSTEEHHIHVTDILVEKEKVKEKDQEKDSDHLTPEPAISHPLQAADPIGEVDSAVRENLGNSNEASTSRTETEIENPLISGKASQMVKKTISFSDDTPEAKVKFQVTCYFAKQFDALRKKCCMGNTEYVRSLCRCKKWGAQGGKSNVFFAKTADDRFVVKQVTRTELTSFLDFASNYFKYLFEALTAGNPTCLAKIFGVYEVKTTKGGKETKMDLLVMENLLYGRHITKLYDLKGSVRSRYNADPGNNQVLLDQNLVEEMLTNPIYVGNKAKRLLERAIWNDTHFLSLVFVMDYSLLVGVDEERQELVVGIIDFIRQYTWDKHLETWVKASGILGGPKNAPPTVISPKQYKKRFRKAMATYFLMVPDQWIPPPQLTVPQFVVNTVEDNISFVMKGEDLPDDPDIPRQISSH